MAAPTAPERFRALVAEREGDAVRRELRELGRDDLPEGEVLVRVGWSSVNYKDALAVSPKGGVARTSPLVPGIDLAGEVVESADPRVPVGGAVLAHGYDLGVSHHGGFAELARVPAGWVVPLPAGLEPRAAMEIGTAGYTAAASVLALEAHGLRAGGGPVLVLGATGGVGACAVAILAALGHEVHAATGKPSEEGFLRALGASEVLSREEVTQASERPLERARWAGCVDPVGGDALAYALRTLRPGAAAAASGNTGGIALRTTVLPFILRGVALVGIDSAQVPIAERRAVWERLASDLRPRALEEHGGVRELALDEVDAFLDEVLAGRARGRTVVRVAR
jgi:putative YhdH/YhfP family quinone oxidoreductase